jgi:hypothetical protein
MLDFIDLDSRIGGRSINSIRDRIKTKKMESARTRILLRIIIHCLPTLEIPKKYLQDSSIIITEYARIRQHQGI